MQDAGSLLGEAVAATLWASAVGATSAPHTRPLEALAATKQLWERRFPQATPECFCLCSCTTLARCR